MKIGEIPAQVGREHGYPVSHETIREELETANLDTPDGPDQTVASLLDTCAELGFGSVYESHDDLQATLLCCADERLVGRVGYDDRGHNPHYTAGEQVSF
jgi:hypothetical protein